MIGGCILIVEDEPVLVRALTDALTAKGCDVISAMDGERGLELALEKRPQLILLDIMLPRVNGFEVCRAIRERGCDMPILMLTAKAQEEDVILGLNLGADDYITKPFRIGELVARVNAFLRRSAVRHEAVCRFIRRAGVHHARRSAQVPRSDGWSTRRLHGIRPSPEPERPHPPSLWSRGRGCMHRRFAQRLSF